MFKNYNRFKIGISGLILVSVLLFVSVFLYANVNSHFLSAELSFQDGDMIESSSMSGVESNLYGWGTNKHGWLGDSTTVVTSPKRIGLDSDWDLVSAGEKHSLGIRSGKLYSWGDGSHGGLLGLGGRTSLVPYQVGEFTDWDTVQAGDSHSLGIRGGKLYAWGWNTYGQLGDATSLRRNEPIQIGEDTDWQEIAVGRWHSLAIKGGRLYAWGFNDQGQLGDGTNIDKNIPTQIGSYSDWESIVAIGKYSLGIRAGKLYAWGLGYGQIQNGTGTKIPAQTQITEYSDWDSVTASGAIRGGKIYTWGSNGYGQIGDGTNTNKDLPIQIGEDTDWDMIIKSYDVSFGIRGGELYGWGSTRKGLFADGNRSTSSRIPKKIGNDNNWEYISIGRKQTYILAIKDSKLYAWGMNDNGEFGDGTTSLRSTPTQIKEGGKWDFIASGNKHSLGIRNGKLYGWGANGAGGIDSTYGTKYSPVQIGSYDDWEYVAAGNQHSLGIRNGKLYGWGANHYCQLGNGREGANPRLGGCNRVYEPTRIGEFSDWEMVEAGYDYTYGIREGKLYAWGSNRNVLGFGYKNNDYITEPTQVGQDNDWVYISASSMNTDQAHTLAIKNGGELYGWGTNEYGQIGDGTRDDILIPRKIGDYSDWSLISVGPVKSSGIRQGKLYFWGKTAAYNNDRLSPTQVGTFTDWTDVSSGLAIRGGKLYQYNTVQEKQIGNYSDWEKVEVGHSFFALRKYIEPTKLTIPTIDQKLKVFPKPEYIELSSAEGASIRYTIDGSNPSEGSSLYVSKILVDKDLTLKAIAYKSGMLTSDVMTKSFAILSGDCDGDGVNNLNDVVVAATNKSKSLSIDSVISRNCVRKGRMKVEEQDISNIYEVYRNQ